MELKPMVINGVEVMLPDDQGYINEVIDLLQNNKVLSMRNYIQHVSTTTLDHCIDVSYHSYITAKARKLNYREAARGGLLHDMFLYDCKANRWPTTQGWHYFAHPKKALENAEVEFELTTTEKEIIRKHMWPATPVPPIFAETYVVLLYDKLCTLKEGIIHSRLQVGRRRMAKAIAA